MAKPTTSAATSATKQNSVRDSERSRRRSRRRSTFGCMRSSSASGKRPRYVACQVAIRIRSNASASSTVARRTPTSGVRVEPVGDAPRVFDAVLGFPATREVVVVLGEPDKEGFLAEHLERREELVGLLDRAAQIALRVEDEERRLHVGDIGKRRAEDQFLGVTPRCCIPHLMLPEVPPDIARTECGDVVRDAALRRRGAEAIV